MTFRNGFQVFPFESEDEASLFIEKLAKRGQSRGPFSNIPKKNQVQQQKNNDDLLLKCVCSIPLNESKSARCLNQFRTLIALANAGEEDLRQIDSLGAIAAKDIYHFFHQKIA
eukprot:TRINITY_DN1914_c0_g2_i2.p1 TRINITY_DN1914_c0_g2~~TRINITY_DN1914_c0_g2_i2.p1  ORF type:complete len:113 (-),score=10.97 TRINITY_DN1914_c0_g2_i2:176-514(-)